MSVQTTRPSRAELAVQAARLRTSGLLYRQIADTLGISVRYAEDLVHDPHGAKCRARKDSYRQPCPVCGTLMGGSNGRTNGPRRCLRCERADPSNLVWTRDRIILAIQAWAGRARDRRAGSTDGPPVAWGDYEPAIQRWEHLTRPAPAPTDERGRLMPELVEWMMGAPHGWTAGVSRTQRLKMLGNGVQVQVAELLGHALMQHISGRAAT